MPPRPSAWVRDDRHDLLLGSLMWLLIILMIVPEGFDYQSLTTTGAPSSGGAVSRMLWLGLLAASALVIGSRPGLAWLLARRTNLFLLAFLALATASVAWSIDPTLSLRRVFRMVSIMAACAAFVLMGWHARRFQNVLRPILTIMLAGSLAFGLAYPTLAIHQETSHELLGAWRGLADHKNGLGALACLGLIFWMHAGLSGQSDPFKALAGGVISATCLVLSRSSTSIAAAVVATAFLLLALQPPSALRPWLPALIALLLVTLAIYSLAVMDLVPGLQGLLTPIALLAGKDTTLTGRTEIWSILSDHIRLHPLLGTGYGAYWTARPVPGTDAYAFIWRMASFYPGSAHNGYFEVLNDLGLAGLAFLLAYLAVQIRQSLALLSIDRSQAILYLALLFQQAITNLSESHWLSVRSVEFVVMTLATMALGRGLLQHQLRQVFGAARAAGASTAAGSRRTRGRLLVARPRRASAGEA
jgi:O-antigen ligase